jgi:2-keto-4-pentenoate hydratase/2-oxohepta-3-ene-1,7-dioic acid hydratase in catechol pathway
MHLIRIGDAGSERPAIRVENSTFDLRPVTADIDGAFLEADGIARARRAFEAGELPPLKTEGQRIAAPIARPGKIVCIGLNYIDHACLELLIDW